MSCYCCVEEEIRCVDGKQDRKVNKVNVSVLEGTVEEQWNSVTVKSKLFLLEMRIENIKYMGCRRTF